uniref:transposase n=1 Tax=Brucella intermedia TaxID=94625 RepID=UPI002B052141|nr:transposase [Brucella intermedia]
MLDLEVALIGDRLDLFHARRVHGCFDRRSQKAKVEHLVAHFLPGDQLVINGILWRFRCGTPWRDVPPKYGNWNTIYRRFRRWSEAGVWEAVSITLAEIMADSGHYSIDSTTVRAHISAAGGRGGFIDALLAARGAGSPVDFTVWLMPEEDRLPSI